MKVVLGLVLVALVSMSCGAVEKVDETARSEGEQMAQTFIDTSPGATYKELADLCEAARDNLKEIGEESENILFSYVLGCKERLREEFPDEQ